MCLIFAGKKIGPYYQVFFEHIQHVSMIRVWIFIFRIILEIDVVFTEYLLFYYPEIFMIFMH